MHVLQTTIFFPIFSGNVWQISNQLSLVNSIQLIVRVGLQYMSFKTYNFNAYTLTDFKLQIHVHLCSLHICYMLKKSTIYNVYLWNTIACMNSLARFFFLCWLSIK